MGSNIPKESKKGEAKGTKYRQEKWKSTSNVVGLNPNISVIIFNVNKLNLKYRLLTKACLKYKNMDCFKVK